jgi:hypothetical protein
VGALRRAGPAPQLTEPQSAPIPTFPRRGKEKQP